MTVPVASEVVTDRVQTDDGEFDVRGTLTITGGHLSHDLYGAFLGPLIPAVQDKLAVPLLIASLMVPAQQLPSIAQPFIGALADRTTKRWFVVFAPAVAAISVSSIGLIPNIWGILLLLVISGLASASFHAPGTALVGELGGNRVGRAMSIFMVGGEVSRSLGPIIITAAISWLTLEGSAVVMVFGLLGTLILFFTLDTSASDRSALERRKSPINLRPLLRARQRWLIGLFGMSTMIVLYTGPLTFLLVAFLQEIGHSKWFSGLALSLLFAAGAAGGLFGGSLSDGHGRRKVLTVLLVLTTPVLYLFLFVADRPGPALVMILIAGFISMANKPIQLAVAQDILPEARGQISGLMLAFGFVAMSAVTLGLSALGDRFGLADAMWILPIFSLLAIPFIWFLPPPGAPLPMPPQDSARALD